jgi:hypothetical protein
MPHLVEFRIAVDADRRVSTASACVDQLSRIVI